MNSPSRQFVSFMLADGWFGLDIRVIKEVNPNTDITPVPRSAPHLRGLVNIRGQVVLVMDIAVIFAQAPQPLGPASHTIILKTAPELQRVRGLNLATTSERFGDKPIAFIADRIGDVVTVATAEVAPRPRHLSNRIAPYIAGVVHLENSVLVVLDAAELLGPGHERRDLPVAAADDQQVKG